MLFFSNPTYFLIVWLYSVLHLFHTKMLSWGQALADGSYYLWLLAPHIFSVMCALYYHADEGLMLKHNLCPWYKIWFSLWEHFSVLKFNPLVLNIFKTVDLLKKLLNRPDLHVYVWVWFLGNFTADSTWLVPLHFKGMLNDEVKNRFYIPDSLMLFACNLSFTKQTFLFVQNVVVGKFFLFFSFLFFSCEMLRFFQCSFRKGYIR